MVFRQCGAQTDFAAVHFGARQRPALLDEGDRKGNKGRGGKSDKGNGDAGMDNNEGTENVRTAEDFLALCVACKPRGHRKRTTAAGTNPP